MRNKQEEKKIARERIKILFQQAEKIFPNNAERANKYVVQARKIAMKVNLPLGRYKRKYCKHCYSFLRTGVNSRIRTRDGKLVIYCQGCKRYTRIPLIKK
tara:strand:+ start:3863 stop:4162 length:300 start_codon:yes stop_codon:yes gene_type:complete